MRPKSSIKDYIRSLLASQRLGHQVVFKCNLPESPASWGELVKPWPPVIKKILPQLGVHKLYRHQVQAMEYVRAGTHVVTATPTASGKSLIYNLPFIEKAIHNPDAKALYLFPLKALAQDQLRVVEKLVALGDDLEVSARIYDGDTSTWHRKKIRDRPPHILLSNPEMLHLSLLPYHGKWATFLSSLEMVVVDEVHTYRGVMGSHMAHVFRRLKRICSYYGASPVFALSSATVGNPDALARQLTGLDVQTVQDSGAPQGSKHLIFIDPVDSPAHTAILLLKAALHRGLRTIIYTQSRKMAELIAVWAGSQAGRYADKISAYRAGYLPQERRAIEAKLASGELLAVVSTSALELGIDIGDLDLCVLVGYPGSVVSTWQRGGRVGRSGQSSAMILVAGSDALDQYFMRNPNDFLARRPEAAVVNPYNPEVLAQQMVCAAAEMPLRTTDPYLADRQLQEGIKTLEEKSQLLRSEDGRTLYAARKAPHRDVNLRGTGSSFSIVEKGTGHNIGDIDIIRAFKETHEGAIYLHKGRTYRVERLDIGAQTIQAIRAAVDYYTRVRSHKETEILETFAQKTFGQTTVSYGRLKVTEQISGYEKRRISTKERLWIVQLQLPPLIFETEGFWIQIPERTQEASESKQLHFMGGIHAIEHAAIGVCPLVVMADRNDLGGISAPFHHQVNRAAIFVYDGIPGGAGLSRQAYEQVVRVFDYTHKAIESCPCENGCPSCVHSPKCGSGNRPIDKAAALFILKHLKRDNTKSKEQQKVHLSIAGASDCRSVPMPEKAGKETRAGIRQPTSRLSGPMMRRQKHRLSRRAAGMPQPAIRRPETLIAEVSSPYRQDRTPGHHYGVFDLETQRSAQEVGGWHRADQMRISCAVLYDSQTDTFHEYLESDIPAFIKHLKRLEKVVGFNILRFDYRVLSGYSSFDFYALNNLDLLDHVHQRLGYRLSLGHLAQTTLGYPKSADGLQALRWWKEKKIRLIVDYCREDVRITRDLFLSGKKDGYLLFTNKAGHTVRLPVDW